MTLVAGNVTVCGTMLPMSHERVVEPDPCPDLPPRRRGDADDLDDDVRNSRRIGRWRT
jgi:hypothetical protein